MPAYPLMVEKVLHCLKFLDLKKSKSLQLFKFRIHKSIKLCNYFGNLDLEKVTVLVYCVYFISFYSDKISPIDIFEKSVFVFVV